MVMAMPFIIEHLARLYVALFAAPWGDQIGVIAAVGVISVTTLALTIAARRVTAIVATLLSVRRKKQEDTEPADVAILLSQSDPDADGHARPRAPGDTLAVA